MALYTLEEGCSLSLLLTFICFARHYDFIFNFIIAANVSHITIRSQVGSCVLAEFSSVSLHYCRIAEFDELILYLFFTSTNLPTLKYHSIAMIFSALISQFTINYSQDFG